MSTHTIRLHRVVRTTPDKIYRAFLDADAMSKWLPPHRPGTRTNITPDSASSRNGRVDIDRQYREPISTSGQLSLGLESRFGRSLSSRG